MTGQIDWDADPILDFESNAIETDEGKLFRPHRDVVARWVVRCESGYRMLGPSFEILYRTKQNDFCRTSLESCYSDRHGGRDIWYSNTSPVIHKIDRLHAVEFLLNNSFDVPDDLAELWEAEQRRKRKAVEPKVRPLSYWAQQAPPWRLLGKFAHQINVLDAVDEVTSLFAAFLQSLKPEFANVSRDVEFFSSRVFARYKVDVSDWMEHHDIPPPEDVALLDLEWPDDLCPAKSTLQELQQVLFEPFSCLGAHYAPIDSEMYATIEEQASAWAVLVDAKPELEKLYTKLLTVLRDIKLARETSSETGSNTVEAPEPLLVASGGEASTVAGTSGDHLMDDMAPEERPLPTLRIEPGGFRYNGVFFKLTDRPLQLLKLFLESSRHQVTRQAALDRIWADSDVKPKNVDTALSELHKVLRESLFLTKDAIVIKQVERGRDATWKLAFRFQLLKPGTE